MVCKKYSFFKNNRLIRPIHVYKERRGYIINFLISNLIINKKNKTLSLSVLEKLKHFLREVLRRNVDLSDH